MLFGRSLARSSGRRRRRHERRRRHNAHADDALERDALEPQRAQDRGRAAPQGRVEVLGDAAGAAARLGHTAQRQRAHPAG